MEASSTGSSSTPPTSLDEVRDWLRRNPPDGTNATSRRQRMAVLQNACDQLTPADYAEYVRTWEAQPAVADQLEQAHPALRYLHAARTEAIADIRRTRLTRGLAVWHWYNMGYVFKTPTACFGIDLTGRDAQQLAADLDFLLITHEHEDHSSPPLLRAMIGRNKPVITRWFAGSTIVSQPTTLQFGDVHVKIDIGDHHHEQPAQRDNMLMFEVDCGPATDNAIIYHAGDGNNYHKMIPSKPVDIFIPHVSVGMSIPQAIAHVKPRMTLISHVLELGHSPVPPKAWRWSFDYAFNVIREIPEKEATVLTWGERWMAPAPRPPR